MNTGKLYHYTYIITNIVLNKYYIGCRSCKVPPIEDIGISYFSSSHDKEFISDQKQNSTHYKYKVIAIFDNKESAISLEIKLHNIHDVGINPKFYNRAKQTSTGWDTTGVDVKSLKIKKAEEMALKKLRPKRKYIMSEEQKAHLRKIRLGRKHSEETKKKLAIANAGRAPMLGKKHTQESKEKMVKSHTGKVHSSDTINKLVLINTGKNNPVAKLANIYEFGTDKLIAENVVIAEWCKHNNYTKSSLSATATADRTKEHHWKTNPLKTKGIYAKYL